MVVVVGEGDGLPVFDDVVAADHRVSNSPQRELLGGTRYAMVVLDVEAPWRDVYPSAETDATEARLALRKLIGPSAAVKSFQRDGARELTTAATDLGFCPSTSRPYVSQSDSVVERAIRHERELYSLTRAYHQRGGLGRRSFLTRMLD